MHSQTPRAPLLDPIPRCPLPHTTILTALTLSCNERGAHPPWCPFLSQGINARHATHPTSVTPSVSPLSSHRCAAYHSPHGHNGQHTPLVPPAWRPVRPPSHTSSHTTGVTWCPRGKSTLLTPKWIYARSLNDSGVIGVTISNGVRKRMPMYDMLVQRLSQASKKEVASTHHQGTTG